MKRIILVVMAVMLFGSVALSQSGASGNKTAASTVHAAAVPATLQGLTFDNDGDASQTTINNQVAMIKALPVKPITRIVFDERTSPSDYTKAIAALHPVSYLMGLFVDSSSMKNTTTAAYAAKVKSFIAAFPTQVDLWEIGNEVNGNWTGPYAASATKIINAYDQVHAAGLQSELTLWENSFAPNNCGDGKGELTAQQFSSQYMPATLRAGIGHVSISWYPTQCSGLKNVNVPAASISAEMQALHALYPNASIGFGELGTPNKVSTKTLKVAQSIATYYYNLNLGLPYYNGGYYWWYAGEDLIPTSKPMFKTISSAMG